MARTHIIGVDIGGTKIAAAIADREGNVLQQIVTPTQAKKGADKVTENIVLCIESLLNETGIKAKKIQYLVLGIPGQINKPGGQILNAPNIPGWKDYALTEKIQKKFPDMPVVLENDANCAAMSEIYFGAGKTYRNIVFITVSTGVGGAIIHDRQIYTGKHNLAGELGHMILNLDTNQTAPCACGRSGCFESYASGLNMAKRARRRLKDLKILKDNYGKIVLDLAERNFNKITSVILGQAAAAGDPFAIEIIKENAFYIGVACANIITILDPEAIIIGGGVSKIGDLLFDGISSTVTDRVKMTDKLTTKILPATLGTDAGLLGAIAVGLSQ